MLLCQEICPLCAQIIQRRVPETAPLFAVGGGGGARGKVQELQAGVKTILHQPFSSGFHNGIIHDPTRSQSRLLCTMQLYIVVHRATQSNSHVLQGGPAVPLFLDICGHPPSMAPHPVNIPECTVTFFCPTNSANANSVNVSRKMLHHTTNSKLVKCFRAAFAAGTSFKTLKMARYCFRICVTHRSVEAAYLQSITWPKQPPSSSTVKAIE